jgi:hypothetical protein
MQSELFKILTEIFFALEGSRIYECELDPINKKFYFGYGSDYGWEDWMECEINLSSMEFYLLEGTTEWFPPVGDWDECYCPVINFMTRTNCISEKHIARLAYVALRKHADWKSLPSEAWNKLREIAFGK